MSRGGWIQTAVGKASLTQSAAQWGGCTSDSIKHLIRAPCRAGSCTRGLFLQTFQGAHHCQPWGSPNCEGFGNISVIARKGGWGCVGLKGTSRCHGGDTNSALCPAGGSGDPHCSGRAGEEHLHVPGVHWVPECILDVTGSSSGDSKGHTGDEAQLKCFPRKAPACPWSEVPSLCRGLVLQWGGRSLACADHLNCSVFDPTFRNGLQIPGAQLWLYNSKIYAFTSLISQVCNIFILIQL